MLVLELVRLSPDLSIPGFSKELRRGKLALSSAHDCDALRKVILRPPS